MLRFSKKRTNRNFLRGALPTGNSPLAPDVAERRFDRSLRRPFMGRRVFGLVQLLQYCGPETFGADPARVFVQHLPNRITKPLRLLAGAIARDLPLLGPAISPPELDSHQMNKMGKVEKRSRARITGCRVIENLARGGLDPAREKLISVIVRLRIDRSEKAVGDVRPGLRQVLKKAGGYGVASPRVVSSPIRFCRHALSVRMRGMAIKGNEGQQSSAARVRNSGQLRKMWYRPGTKILLLGYLQ
jgi:hypothetical protein